MKTVTHKVDLCVVGGGIAGMCAAMAAARNGAKTILMHDRPVLGGNASSEVRMWICGAQGPNMRETGIVEEIQMENLRRNPHQSYAMWDAILHEKVAFQENLTPLLNCSCNSAEMDGDKIKSVKGWQLTTETWHVVEAGLFADCSGDSILAPLSGAEFRMGREGKGEFGESIAPEKPDGLTMGMSCLIQARETDTPQKFIPPPWAHKYDDDFFAGKFGKKTSPFAGGLENFWWLEIGGMGDTVHDAEKNRDELLKIAFGVWDYYKNGVHGKAAEKWALDWVGFLPGKRESRRYAGDHILTQNDVRAEGRFEDMIAYGGWSMDDHFPEGFCHMGGCPTIFHEAPCPYGIPYRCVYSRNIGNLFFAGRNISATHSAMSSTRVMSTCATLGQAVGTAAAMCVKNSMSPRELGQKRIAELKQALMNDDCWLPWNKREPSALTMEARLSASKGDPEPLRNGLDRQIGDAPNSWRATAGDRVEFTFPSERKISGVRLVFDSDLRARILNMPAQRRKDMPEFKTPDSMVSDFHIDVKGPDGKWRTVREVKGNYQRLVSVGLDGVAATAVRICVDKTWGAEETDVYAADIL